MDVERRIPAILHLRLEPKRPTAFSPSAAPVISARGRPSRVSDKDEARRTARPPPARLQDLPHRRLSPVLRVACPFPYPHVCPCPSFYLIRSYLPLPYPYLVPYTYPYPYPIPTHTSTSIAAPTTLGLPRVGRPTASTHPPPGTTYGRAAFPVRGIGSESTAAHMHFGMFVWI